MNLMWFRRDLRIDDNPALIAALQSGPTQALFIATPEQWQQHDMAPIQVDFIERHLNLLAEQLAKYGIPLTVLTVPNYASCTIALKEFCHTQQISQIFANQEVELNECIRDRQILAAGLNLTLYEADVIVPKGTVKTGKGDMFHVFTPFRNAWVKQLQQHSIKTSSHPSEVLTHYQSIRAEKIVLEATKRSSEKWPLVSDIKKHVIPDFLQTKHADYKQYRDFPALKGTSGVSPYLAIGALSSKMLASQVLQHVPFILDNAKADIFCWLNELAWRDFYKHLLFAYPNLIKGITFSEKYSNLNWPNSNEYFIAWCEGRTGYPLVDAAMRQLRQTGWMHNRLRMVVASFLTKHLLVDWRLGEQFFMQHLIDGDFSANNGGWQWAAGTGCDAQPYFRIFNPITQSEKFDPDGSFIRKYLPELSNVPVKYIHLPHSYLAATGQSECYWPAIVEHSQARQIALAFYKQQLGAPENDSNARN
ncbi:deoxyribodipyrimidine photo-lyase [Pseudoalteromonas tunicata]|uniref:deoxyribodipyrimidine photo-lyase n=1 Tax=Pseudoalteromonas tunicata TaxID=314281 RepID=UPI00273FF2D0|nr:deoxyribodipyrimidine photo-lyase [Pseudoalteromonas tunicata]MDP5214166.1 deoxyribodipyrimidine photo-lyase [Pseudoalteromonas tunicata]